MYLGVLKYMVSKMGQNAKLVNKAYLVNMLKPFQNKKGQKHLRYPTKKKSFSKKKDCFFVGYLRFFWPFLFWNGFSKVT